LVAAEISRRPQWPGKQGDAGQEFQAIDRDRLPVFPPAPNDLARWVEVLAIDPSLEPAICGMADGLAPRMDRLAMLGNGVVPVAAAYAFLSLWACLLFQQIRQEGE
jgi:hypothetical protein